MTADESDNIPLPVDPAPPPPPEDPPPPVETVTRDVLNLSGVKIGELTLPATTTEDEWAARLALPPAPTMQQIIDKKIIAYQQIAPILLRELYVQNTLAGITVQQSDQMFDEFADVVIRIREGTFPTALYRIQQKTPEGFVTQELLDSWIRKIQTYMG